MLNFITNFSRNFKICKFIEGGNQGTSCSDFQDFMRENWAFLLLFSKILILTKLINGIGKRCSKCHYGSYLGHVLSIPFVDLVKIRFFEKSSINGQFSLNEVQKISNKIFFSIKSKMFLAQGFHINFQFWLKKQLPRDLWILQTPRKQNQAMSARGWSNFQFFGLR